MASITYGSYKIPGVSQAYLVDYPNGQDVQRFSVRGGGTTQYFAATSNFTKISSNDDRCYECPVLKHNGKTYYFVKPLNKLYLRFKYIAEYTGDYWYEGVPIDNTTSTLTSKIVVDLYNKVTAKIGIVDYRFRFPVESDMIVYTSSIGYVGKSQTGGWAFSYQTAKAKAECFVSQKLLHDKTTWADGSPGADDTGYQSDNQYSAYLSESSFFYEHTEAIPINLYIRQFTTSTVDCSVNVNIGSNGGTTVVKEGDFYSADGGGNHWGADTTCAAIMTYINSSGQYDCTSDSDSGDWWQGCSCSISAKAIPATGTYIGSIRLSATRWKVDDFTMAEIPVPGSTQNEKTKVPTIIPGGTRNDGSNEAYRGYRFVIW